MTEPIVTISGQRVYPRGQSPNEREPEVRPDARNAAGRPLAATEMAPSGWASGGNEETLQAGLPFLGGLVAVILFTIGILLLVRRPR
jgi:hypothetical protein